jgi:hypothetical protein
VCDQTNNPPSVIDSRDLVLDIAYKDSRGNLFHTSYRKSGFSAIDVDISVDDDDVYVTSNGAGSIWPTLSGNSITPAPQNSINNMVGILTTGTNVGVGAINGTYTISAVNPVLPTLTLQDPITDNPNLPGIEFHSHDDARNQITLTLKPEGTVTPYESLLITMLIQCASTNPSSFSVFHFVRKNNLEKHFKYAL